jgi:putative transposase
VLLRLACLGVTNALAMLRLLPMSDRAKDAETLALRHQITVLERQLQGSEGAVRPADRAFLAAVLHRLPATCCAGSGCSCAQKPCAAGTAT